MPWLNPTLALTNPRFCEQFTITRRQEIVNSYGETTTVNSTLLATGVVNITFGSNELERGPDEQHQGKSISITTKFRLYGEVVGYQPDLITWHGDTFLVTKIEDYLGFGAGFVQAEARSIDFVDAPPSL